MHDPVVLWLCSCTLHCDQARCHKCYKTAALQLYAGPLHVAPTRMPHCLQPARLWERPCTPWLVCTQPVHTLNMVWGTPLTAMSLVCVRAGSKDQRTGSGGRTAGGSGQKDKAGVVAASSDPQVCIWVWGR